MILLVGLGNPGPKYALNRHNIGFMAVDEIHRHWSLSPWRQKFQGEVAEGRVGGKRVLALKPMTFMNESGRSVQQACAFYKVVPKDIIVFHDELDLAGGKLRMKDGGGHAGHNGLRSLHAHIGPDYKRVRLGIGHPGSKEKVIGYVLKDFSKTDQTWLDPLIDAIAAHADRLVEGDGPAFMSKVAQELNPPRPGVPNPNKPNSEET